MTGRRVLLALAVVLSLTAWLAAPVAAQKRGGTIVVGNAASLNRQEIIDTVLLGRGKLTAAIPPATVPYVLPPNEIATLPFYKQDYELVKKLLREGGQPNGFEFVYKTSPHSPDYVPAAQVIQRQ